MSWLGKLFLGNGTLKPELRSELEAEGLVLIEEGLPGTIRYKHFRAPGRRFNGKVVAERFGLGISEERFVVYCRSGRAELMDSPFTSPNLRALDVSLEGDDVVALHVDYDRLDEPGVSGELTVRAHTARATEIVALLRARIASGP